MELEALAASGNRDTERAIKIIRNAVALEETNSPPSGPPDVIKPPHELCGEILLVARTGSTAKTSTINRVTTGTSSSVSSTKRL
jgi:hypothetical protein